MARARGAAADTGPEAPSDVRQHGRGEAIDLRGSGFRSIAELDDWLSFVAWSNENPDVDPWYYNARYVQPAEVLPFIHALADLLVADLLRVAAQKS